MIRVGARFGGNADYATARAPILRVVEVGDDLEFLGGVDRGDIGDILVGMGAVACGIGDGIVGCAIDQEFIGLAKAAVDGKIRLVAVIEWPA